MANITVEEIDTQLIKDIKIEDYSQPKTIDGVRLFNLNLISSEDGYFLELARLGKNSFLKKIPGFKIQQISYSQIDPGVIKAWHIHRTQDDLWFVPPDNKLLIGLYDLRKKSPTKNFIMRLILGNHNSNLLLIPR